MTMCPTLAANDDVTPEPRRELVFREPAVRQRNHGRHHVALGCRELLALEMKKDHHREESDSLVAIAIGMAGDDAETVRSRKTGEIARPGVFPPVPRPRESRFEGIFIPGSPVTTVLPQLIEMNRIHYQTTQPPRLCHRSTSPTLAARFGIGELRRQQSSIALRSTDHRE